MKYPFPKWLVSVWAVGLVIALAFSFAQAPVGPFAGELAWQFFGAGLAIFGLDYILQKHKWDEEQYKRKEALVAAWRLVQSIEGLWRSIITDVQKEAPARPIFSEPNAHIISQLVLNSPAPIAPARPWATWLVEWERRHREACSRFYLKQLHIYCCPELDMALERIERNGFTSWVQLAEWVSENNRRAGDPAPTLMWGRNDANFFKDVEVFRHALKAQAETISKKDDVPKDIYEF